MFLDLMQYFTGVFVVVYEGQHAVKFHLGRVKEVVGPGVHFKWPIIQNFKKEETKDTTLDLETQVIHLRDDLVFEVSAKVVYQIVDLHKAMVEVDDLREGLKNRITLSVQRVLQEQDRGTIHDIPAISGAIREDLADIEEKWGFRIRELGFAQFSPTPATLEITQLRQLAREKLDLYEGMRRAGLTEEAAVSLISGAVVALQRQEAAPEVPADDAPGISAKDLVEDQTDSSKDAS